MPEGARVTVTETPAVTGRAAEREGTEGVRGGVLTLVGLTRGGPCGGITDAPPAAEAIVSAGVGTVVAASVAGEQAVVAAACGVASASDLGRLLEAAPAPGTTVAAAEAVVVAEGRVTTVCVACGGCRGTERGAVTLRLWLLMRGA